MANRLVPDHRQHERTFLPLSAPAKLCWFVATLELGASGIGTLYPVALTPLASLTLDQVEAGLAELEAGGYLRRDGAVMWLVANLLEQGLNPRSGYDRAEVEDRLADLTPLAPGIVAEFRRHYSTWFHADVRPVRGPRRRAIPGDVRQRIYARDGHRCLHCGRADRLSIDHIVPFIRGGSEDEQNLQTLCTPCNSSKGAR